MKANRSKSCARIFSCTAGGNIRFTSIAKSSPASGSTTDSTDPLLLTITFAGELTPLASTPGPLWQKAQIKRSCSHQPSISHSHLPAGVPKTALEMADSVAPQFVTGVDAGVTFEGSLPPFFAPQLVNMNTMTR